ncbi:MAG: hypothetical protein AAF682_15110 [Planctomycetota bacterium]
MNGNVLEWCLDDRTSDGGPVVPGSGELHEGNTSNLHAVRGGSVLLAATRAHWAARFSRASNLVDRGTGLLAAHWLNAISD